MFHNWCCIFLQQALVGEASGEEQLFSSENSSMRDSIGCELNTYLEKIKVGSFLFLSVSCCPLMDSFLKQAFYTFLFSSLILLADSVIRFNI